MADYLHPEVRNLASNLDEDELKKIGAQVIEEYRADEDSRHEWMSQHASWLKLYYQKDAPVNPPWEGSSDESLPLLAEGCTQFSARAYQAMFPSRGFLKAIPVGKEDPNSTERAKRVSAHMAWQLLVKDRFYKRNKDRLLQGLPLHGSVFTKTFYDPVLKRNVVKNVRAVDLVLPHGVGPRDLEDIERKTEIIRMSVNKTKILKSKGFFIAEGVPASFDEANKLDQAHASIHGLQDSGGDLNKPCIILEQHRLLDLDDDGIAEPYIVFVDKESQKVLRISIRYETDELGTPVNDKEPVEYYTHYPYMENPDGIYGLGLGHLISQLNRAVNKLLRQHIDAGTLANVGNQSGIISQQVAGVAGGELRMHLGKFIKVPGTTDDLSKGIFQFKFPGPTPANMQALQLIAARSDRLATVTEAITGQTEKVMQPTTILALIEQSLQIFSTVYERVITSWGDELKKIYDLNYKHMDPKEYFSVLDSDGTYRGMNAARQDYAPDLQIIPIVDPKMATEQQRLSKSQAEWQFLSQNPLTMNSPPHFYNASRRYLEAIKSEAIDEVLPNPASQMMPRVDDPMVENSLVLSPVPGMPMAFIDQDHDAHLQVHMALLDDPAAQMSLLGRKMLEDHIRAHYMMKSGMTGGVNAQNGGSGMAGGTMHTMGSEFAGPAVPGSRMEDGIVSGQAKTNTGMAGGSGFSQKSPGNTPQLI